jgi:hypothetical protein
LKKSEISSKGVPRCLETTNIRSMDDKTLRRSSLRAIKVKVLITRDSNLMAA